MHEMSPGHQEELLLLARLGGSLALVLVLVVIQSVPESRLVLTSHDHTGHTGPNSSE